MYDVKSGFLCFDKFVNLDDQGRVCNTLILIDNSKLGEFMQKITDIFDTTISVSVNKGKKIKSYHVASHSFKRFIRREFRLRVPQAAQKKLDEWVNTVINKLNTGLCNFPLQSYFSKL